MNVILIYNQSLFSNNTSANIFRRFIKTLKLDPTFILIGYYGIFKRSLDSNSKYIKLNSLVYSRLFIILKKRVPFLRKLILFYEYQILPKIFSKKIIYIIRKKKVNKCWVYSCLETIPTVYYLIKNNDIDLHFSVHDDIPNNFYFFRKIAHQKLVNMFVFLLQKSKSLDLISDFMRYEYQKKYNISESSLSIWGGFCPTDVTVGLKKTKELSRDKNIKNEIKIIFGGSISTIIEHRVFWNVLNKINLNTDYYITMDYFTQDYNKKYFNSIPDFISFNKFLPEDKFINLLPNYNYAFTPMSFKPEYEFAMKIAFPSKVNIFLCAKIPIISIAPNYSSIFNFIKKNRIGVCFPYLNEEKIYLELVDFFSRTEELKEIFNNIENAISSTLNYEIGVKKFKDILFS